MLLIYTDGKPDNVKRVWDTIAAEGNVHTVIENRCFVISCEWRVHLMRILLALGLGEQRDFPFWVSYPSQAE